MTRRRLGESEVRKTLLDIPDRRSRPYTWVTGKVEPVLSSGETVHGNLERIDGRDVVARTADGPVEAAVWEVENVVIGMCSPGPE